MPAKKKIIIAVIFVVAVVLTVFWYVGSTDRQKKQEVEQRHYAEVLKKEAQLRALVANAITNSTSSELEDFDQKDLPAKLTSKNLKVLTTSSTTLKKYGSDMLQILQPFEEERVNEAETMLKALDLQSDLEAEKIIPNRELYNESAIGLTKIGVPSQIVISHLKLVNSLREMAVLSNNMIDVLRNPILALQSADVFRQKQIIFYSAIKEINSYLGRQGVKFDEDKKIDFYLNFK